MVKCMKCDWFGCEEDLKFILEDGEDLESGINACPNCKTDGYLIDGWIKCCDCDNLFKGMEGKEDTCPKCLKKLMDKQEVNKILNKYQYNFQLQERLYYESDVKSMILEALKVKEMKGGNN